MSGKTRIAWAGLAGVLAVVAPLVVFFAASPADEAAWAAPWVAAAILGPLVFELLSRPRPEWSHGLAFAAALGVVFGVWAGIDIPFEHSGAGQAALLGLLLLAATFLGGMAGASAASLIARGFDYRDQRRGPGLRRLHPWHVGVALVVAEIAAVAAVGAATV